MTKHTPATPLHPADELAAYIETCSRTSVQAHFITLNKLKANEVARFLRAHSKLVEALREIADYTPPSKVQPALIARGILRELGEDS